VDDYFPAPEISIRKGVGVVKTEKKSDLVRGGMSKKIGVGEGSSKRAHSKLVHGDSLLRRGVDQSRSGYTPNESREVAPAAFIGLAV